MALIVESGEPREVMHYCLLIGYGASAINPYLAIETLEELAASGDLPRGITPEQAVKNYIKAVNKGLLKVFSKMGISTLQSYRGAQIFEAIGLNEELVKQYFTGTSSRIEGVGLDVLAREAIEKHAYAFRPRQRSRDRSWRVGGNYQYRIHGERHLIESGDGQQAAARGAAARASRPFRNIRELIDEQNEELCTLRGLMRLQDHPQRRSARGSGAGDARSSSALPPARCRLARSARKRTRRWPSP